MDYFPRKSLSKYLTDTTDFNKQDINIFINDKWRKYAGGDIGWPELQGNLNFAFDQWESEVDLHKATSLSESPSNVSPDSDCISASSKNGQKNFRVGTKN